MCMWQSQAFGGAFSFGGSVPADQGTVCACPAARIQSACHDDGRSHGFEKASAGYGAAHARILPAAGGDPLAGGVRLRQSRAASKSPTRDLLVDATIRATSARRTGNSSVSNHGLRLSQRVVAPGGMGHGHETRMVG